MNIQVMEFIFSEPKRLSHFGKLPRVMQNNNHIGSCPIMTCDMHVMCINHIGSSSDILTVNPLIVP